VKRLVLLLLLFAAPAHAAGPVRSADGFATIEAAIAYVSALGGGVVTLDSLSTYDTTTSPSWTPPLIVPANVIIRGKGPEATTLFTTVAGDSNSIQLKGSYASLEDLTVDGLGTSGTARSVAIGDTGAVVKWNRLENVVISNAPGYGIYVFGFDDSSATYTILTSYKNVLVDAVNTSLYDVKLGTGATTQWFTNCSFEGAGSGVLDKSIKAVFRGCVFEGTTDRVEYTASDATAPLLEGCHFEHGASTAANWFINTTGVYGYGLAVRDCIFIRTAISPPRILKTSATGSARGLILSGLTAYTLAPLPTNTDDIVLSNATDDAVIIGGIRIDTSVTQTDGLKITATEKTQFFPLQYGNWPLVHVKGQ